MVVESALHKIIPYLRQRLHILRKLHVPVIGFFLDRFGKWIVVTFFYMMIIHCSIKILKNALNCFWSREKFRLSRCNTTIPPPLPKKRNGAKKFCVRLWLICINYQRNLCNIMSLIHQCFIETHLLELFIKRIKLFSFVE